LGFAERDPVRSNDSFAAFEEVLLTAKEKKSDFVLLGGDVFHENKPSRRTMHTAMDLLRKYCLGDDPVYAEVIQSETDINYEDPFHDVSLPVFSIHGNHDDPTREGGNGDSLAAMDLLAVSKLVNYFGKAEKVEDILITPILLKKGPTHVAIYGLGAMRDERLHRMWQQKKVKFNRPVDRDNFLNVFVVHQNRDYGRGSKNCLHESMIPEWMGT
jgi:double-strand break repair protein MRE11